MHALTIIPGKGSLQLAERPEPRLEAPDEIKVRIIRVGICGTDREQAECGRALAPVGRDDLVIGHEMFGEVIEVGDAVTRVTPGDRVVFTVRRSCGKCMPCRMFRPDMCRTGDFRERGIWGLDGFQTNFVVDREPYVVRVPDELEALGVLCEPLSVAEKAVDEVVRLQEARLPDAPSTPKWLHGRRCLVAGLGPVGLLAAMVLRLRDAEVYGLDIVDADTARPQWLARIGGQYIDGRKIAASRLDDEVGELDIIVEAAGVASLGFNLIDALAYDGAYVLTGIPGDDRTIEIPAAELMSQLVLRNQLVVGSVNAARDHFQMAVTDLHRAEAIWPGHSKTLITHRYSYTQFAEAIYGHDDSAIKSVLEWE